jgi:hypothetical protein
MGRSGHSGGREPIGQHRLASAFNVARPHLREANGSERPHVVDAGEALVARGGVGTQVTGDAAAVADVLEPPFRHPGDGDASVEVDGVAVELVAKGAGAPSGARSATVRHTVVRAVRGDRRSSRDGR